MSEDRNVYPLVSVVVVNYNYADYLGAALDSVAEQTFGDYEVIVVDDGSTDRSRQVAESRSFRFKDRFRYHFQENQGVAAARNAGLRLAKGRYIAFLDADDLWMPDKLSRQVEALERFSSVGFCCSDYLNLFRWGESSHFASLPELKDLSQGRPIDGRTALSVLFLVNFVGTPTVMFRSSLAREVGWFDPELRRCEDYDYWLRCASRTDFFVIREPLVRRRIHGASLTADFLSTCELHRQVLERFRAASSDHGPRINRGLARINYLIGNLCFEHGDRRAAFRHYFMGLEQDRSGENVREFLGIISRKSVRLLSGGFINRKRLRGGART